MLAPATDIANVKKFLVKLAGALKNPYSGLKPYLCLDNHPAHRSPHVREELERFHICFQPAYTSTSNCQEAVWAQLKREFYTRLHRRDSDLANADEFKAMIQQLCDDVPINVDAMLRTNTRFIAQHLALGVRAIHRDHAR